METVTIPRDLFGAVNRYLLEHAPADQKAEGLYNGMVLAFAAQQASAEETTMTAEDE